MSDVPENNLHAAAPEGALSRADELLADRATQGLSEAESAELAQLLAKVGLAEDRGVDIAAAALERAMYARDDADGAGVPASLLASLEREGQAWCAGVNSGQKQAGVLARIGGAPGRAATAVLESRPVRAPVVMGRRLMREWSGWVAAAACAAFAVYTWSHMSKRVDDAQLGAQQTAQVVPSDLVKPVERFADDVGARALSRLSRFHGTADLVVVPIGRATPEASGNVKVGEVIWSKLEGRGVAHLRDLPPLNNASEQYQLWVFDNARSERFPVDGGVITVRDGQTELLVPIDPSLPVGEAAAFAVTIEDKGGVVVTARDRMVAVGVAEGMAPPPVFEDLPKAGAKDK
jgi:hypothetical protein